MWDSERRPRSRVLATALALVAHAAAADEPPPRVVRHQSVTVAVSGIGGKASTHRLDLGIAVMGHAGWRAEEVLDAARQAARILAQCGIETATLDLFEVDAPKRYLSLFTPVSRDLARQLGLPRPTVFFMADTLNRPAFDAEAVGRGNSRSRPEMADTVWIVSGTRDLPVVIAHELAHVLADSGSHSEEIGNLMREETTAGATQLTPAQCAAMVTTGGANGLLQPLR